jgi:Bacterial PH domain
MVFVIVVFTVPQRALRYHLQPQKLEIHHWFGRHEINLQDAKLEVLKIKSVRRLLGISTGFYSAGLFRLNNEEMKVYGSSFKGDVVVIRQADKNTIITPTDPQAFLKLVEESELKFSRVPPRKPHPFEARVAIWVRVLRQVLKRFRQPFRDRTR